MKLKIKVTKEILKRSMKYGLTTSNCAIAVACSEVLEDVSVYSTSMTWNDYHYRAFYQRKLYIL